MRTLRHSLVVLLVVVTALSPVTFAQERHVVDPARMAAADAEHAASQDADRAAVREALNRPEVREVAERFGIDLALASAAVDKLQGADLERAASAARQIDEPLVGGASTVVISTTTIIIVLLLIILIVLIAD